MTASRSLVEALQRDINAFREKKALLKGDPTRAAIIIAVPLFEALLELAIADAEIKAHEDAEPDRYFDDDEVPTEQWTHWDECHLEFFGNLQTARDNLNRVIQQ